MAGRNDHHGPAEITAEYGRLIEALGVGALDEIARSDQDQAAAMPLALQEGCQRWIAVESPRERTIRAGAVLDVVAVADRPAKRLGQFEAQHGIG